MRSWPFLAVEWDSEYSSGAGCNFPLFKIFILKKSNLPVSTQKKNWLRTICRISVWFFFYKENWESDERERRVILTCTDTWCTTPSSLKLSTSQALKASTSLSTPTARPTNFLYCYYNSNRRLLDHPIAMIMFDVQLYNLDVCRTSWSSEEEVMGRNFEKWDVINFTRLNYIA